MLTWPIAYAIAHGASQNWFWLAIPVDFMLFAVLIQTFKEYIRMRAMEETTSQLFTRINDD